MQYSIYVVNTRLGDNKITSLNDRNNRSVHDRLITEKAQEILDKMKLNDELKVEEFTESASIKVKTTTKKEKNIFLKFLKSIKF